MLKAMTTTYLLVWLGLTNVLLSYLMYRDKQKARKRKYRIPEKYLLLLGILGGGLGGILGMQLFRHKTKHTYFYLVYILGISIWVWILINVIQ